MTPRNDAEPRSARARQDAAGDDRGHDRERGGRRRRGREGRPDLRLVPATVACWGAVLLALPADPAVAVLVSAVGAACSVVLGGVAVAVVGRVRASRRPAAPGRTWMTRAWGPLAAALVCAAAGGLSAAAHSAAVHGGPLAALAGQYADVTAELTVTADPARHEAAVRGSTLGRAYVSVLARVDEVDTPDGMRRVRTPVLVTADGAGWDGVIPSTRLRVVGRLKPAEGGRPVAALLSVRAPPEVLAGPNAAQRVAERFRSGLRTAVSGLPADERGLLPAIVDGDTSQMNHDLDDDFQAASLTHITAVSGANIAILSALILFLTRLFGLRGPIGFALVAVVTMGFVVLCRPQPSVLRAAVMAGLTLLALATGRRRRGLPLLCGAVLLLLLADPYLAVSLGFVLSVAATAGLFVLAPGWRDALIARGMSERTAEALAVPAAAQAACGPFLAMALGEASLVGVPAGLLAEVAVGPATVLGVLVTAVAPVCMPLARLLAWAAAAPAWWIVEVAHVGARLPGSGLHWPTGLGGGLAMVAATVGAGIAFRFLTRGPRGCSFLPLGLAVLLVAVLLARPAFRPGGWPPSGWVMVACDVGQGDALVLAAGPGSAVVVDAGPDARAVDGCLDGLGVRRVPILILTHLHADHVEGVPGVLHDRSVGAIEVTNLPEPRGEAFRLARWAAGARVPVVAVAPGERRAVGDLAWQVLWPDGAPLDRSPNDASIVIRVEDRGVSILLTGDVEPPAQQALLDEHADIAADVLKVPHHGSAFQDPALLRAVHPKAALISVGADNPFGHPAPGTLRLLPSLGARVFRTDLDGSVAVVSGPGGVSVATEGG